jgi:hypothetical protein
LLREREKVKGLFVEKEKREEEKTKIKRINIFFKKKKDVPGTNT